MHPTEKGNTRRSGTKAHLDVHANPNIPTLAEQGLPGIDVALWYGISAPAKTPAPIKDYLAKEILAVLQDPAVLKDLQNRGMVVQPKDSKEFAQFLNTENSRLSALIKTKNMQIDN